MRVLWNNCFLCTTTITAIDEEDDDIGERLGRHSFTPCHKLLLKYLLNDKHLEEPGSKRVVQFLETSEILPDQSDASGGSQGRTSSHFRLCSECDETARVVLDLQLQLDEIQMTIANYVTTLRNSVVNNSNLYGWNKAVGNKFRKFEKELEKEEANGESCEVARQFLEVLHQFQTAVVESDGDIVRVPLVYLEKYKCTPGKMELHSRNQNSLRHDIPPVNVEATALKREIYVNMNDDNDCDSNYGGYYPSDNSLNEDDRDDFALSNSDSDSFDTDSAEGPTSSRRKFKKKKRTPRRPFRKPRDSTDVYSLTLIKGRCDVCNERVKEGEGCTEMLAHLQTHHGSTTFSCPVEQCDRVFGKLENLVNHSGTHKGFVSTTCALCPQRQEENSQNQLFTLQEQLPRHLYEVHGWEQMLLKCVEPTCTRTFFDRRKRLGHEAQNHKEWMCDICNQSLPSGHALEKHKSIEHNVKKFVCNDCPGGKDFPTRSSLLHHRQLTHRIRPYVRKRPQCETCGKTFSRPKYLQKHLEAGHGDGDTKLTTTFKRYSFLYQRNPVGEYYCHECQEEFKSVHKLSKHYVVDHNYPEYQCDLCPRTFKLVTLLQSHEKISHGVGLPASAGYQCSHCPKQFFRESTLREHEAVHGDVKNYTCEKCGHSFKTKNSLKEHIRNVHAEGVPGGRKHMCSVCSKTFSQRSLLVHHERDHTGERPFECGQCGEAFKFKVQLKRHSEKFHEVVQHELLASGFESP